LTTGQCNCQPNTYGRECNQCQIGYWNFPDCQQCNCNGHATACDSKTGECLSCQDYTTGYNCDRCIESYYGDPLLGSEIGCRPCRCPDTIASGHSHASQCLLISNNDVVCYCEPGYAGTKCDVCDNNYFGHPDKPGGDCKQCNCTNNVDLNRSGNCDARTGKCLLCLYDTDGDNCEHCRDGYYGDASRQDCRRMCRDGWILHVCC
jgi:laminin beta 1